MMKPELRLKSTSVGKTVAIVSPERLTRGAKPKGMRKIQSNPFISQFGEMEVEVNDEVTGSIPVNGSREKFLRCFCRDSSVAEHRFRKAGTWVRFPPSAPKSC